MTASYARPVTPQALADAEREYLAAQAAEAAAPRFAPGGMKLTFDRAYASDYLDLLRRWYAEEQGDLAQARA